VLFFFAVTLLRQSYLPEKISKVLNKTFFATPKENK
jgi:hypothetical protein